MPELKDSASITWSESGGDLEGLAEQLSDGTNTVTAAQARSHIDDSSNPHGVTAAQASAVALSGDTMTGDLIVPNVVLDDSGTIGSATTSGALTIASNGDVTAAADAVVTGDLDVSNVTVDDGGTIGSATTPGAIEIASDGKLTTATSFDRLIGSNNSAELLYNIRGTSDAGLYATRSANSGQIGWKLRAGFGGDYNAAGIETGGENGDSRTLQLYYGSGDTVGLNINTAGNVEVSDGNLVIGTSGKGIDFSATSDAAGSTSELLDDYEEGTWTPALWDNTSGGTEATYGSRSGQYVKVGRSVTAFATFIDVDTTSMTSGNDIIIRGLPFTTGRVCVGQLLADSLTFTSGYVVAFGFSGQSYLKLRRVSSGAGDVDLEVSSLSSGTSDLTLSITYEV